MYTSAGSPEENTSPGRDRSLERETDKERKYACDFARDLRLGYCTLEPGGKTSDRQVLFSERKNKK